MNVPHSPLTDDPSVIRGRRLRDGWLSAAAFVSAVTSGLVVLVLTSTLREPGPYSRGLGTTQLALEVMYELLFTAGFAAIGIALARRDARRASAWQPGAILLAAGYALSLAGQGVWLYALYAPYNVTAPYRSASFYAAMSLEILRVVWGVVAALLLAALFRPSRLLKSDASPPERAGREREKDAGSANSGAICATEDVLSGCSVRSGGRGFPFQQPPRPGGTPQAEAVRRSRRLGWVTTGFAAIWGASMIYQVVVAWGPWSVLGFMMSTSGPAAAIFRFAGYAIAAIAFSGATRSLEGEWARVYHRRERLLIVAALALLVSYALTVSSWFPEGGSWPRVISEGRIYVMSPLRTDVLTAIAALCLAIAFWVSARSLRGGAARR